MSQISSDKLNTLDSLEVKRLKTTLKSDPLSPKQRFTSLKTSKSIAVKNRSTNISHVNFRQKSRIDVQTLG